MPDRALQSSEFLQGEAIHSQWETDYLNPDMDRFYDAAFAEIVKRAGIKRTEHILDAGCGYCYHSARLARFAGKITGVDFSEAALAAAVKNAQGKPISLQQADLTALPFVDATFDHVICWGVLMHVPEYEQALSELARVLKPGGTLVISENNVRAPDVAIRERLLRGIKRLIRRERSTVNRTPRGLEVWTDRGTGGLLVRKADPYYLKDFLDRLGLRQTDRMAGELTQAYTNMPVRTLKRALYAVNLWYFKHVGRPGPALGNIFFFRKGL